MKKLKYVSVLIIIAICMSLFNLSTVYAAEATDYKVDLSNLTYEAGGTKTEIKKYTQDDFETFLADYNSGNLPEIYVTEFLFDGVSMMKVYDLDDFIEGGNDVDVDTLKITAVNVNTTGNIEFSGEITGGMIAVNTNGVSGEINLILNGVKIDTDSKKTPAIFVYNKDITYTGCKVTIKTASGSKNYVEGGKFKKVSLVGSDELSNYSSKYSGDSSTWYSTYTNYYGVYTSEQINNVLFAKVQADNEDLADGDPYYFYKAAGAISSDIDLYFEGTGYLEVTSKNKEGIETKGNLTFTGGTGDYVIYAEDDCLNTTTSSSSNKSARNALTIDVKSLTAIVDSGEDADEGDAIDSNGTLVINGGTIIALAHPGQDAGLDAESGTYINGGTILATGDMFDSISSESKQNYMVLGFQNNISANTLISLLNENDEALMAYKTDRTYTNLVYSSADLKEGAYYLYKGGSVEGDSTNGFYSNVTSYTKGTQQAYSSTGNQGGMPGGMNGGRQGGRTFDTEMQDNGERPELPDGEMPNNGERSELPDGEMPSNGERPELSEKMTEKDMSQNMRKRMGQRGNMEQPENIENNATTTATNKEFNVTGISNQFSGIADYTDGETVSETTSSDTNNKSSDTQSNSVMNFINKNVIAISSVAGVIILVAILGVIAIKTRKNK